MRSITYVMLISCALSAPASAQGGDGIGFWMGAGVAGGVGRVGCNVCRGDFKVAPSVQVRAGGTLSRHVLLGVEANGWIKNQSELGVRDRMLGVGAVMYWYPGVRARYYLKGGFGPLFFRAADSDVPVDQTPDPAITSSSFAGHFGAGYEVGAGSVVFTPFVNLTASLYGGLSQDRTRLTDAGLTLFQLGVGIRWR